eukprot:9298954-Prorocentrum_lima.AAC.1
MPFPRRVRWADATDDDIEAPAGRVGAQNSGEEPPEAPNPHRDGLRMASGLATLPQNTLLQASSRAVSYTHLTLPTICSV